MKFESKAHMAQVLIAGKRFKTTASEVEDAILFYDETKESPFRYTFNGREYDIGHIWSCFDQDIWTEVKPRHIHQELIDSYQEGQAWQYKSKRSAVWQDITSTPMWGETLDYRLHPYNDLIQAHRNGAEIQAYIVGDWVDEPNPDWHEDTQYRIKPETKTVYEWMCKARHSGAWFLAINTEDEAKVLFPDNERYKTGRSWEVEV